MAAPHPYWLTRESQFSIGGLLWNGTLLKSKIRHECAVTYFGTLCCKVKQKRGHGGYFSIFWGRKSGTGIKAAAGSSFEVKLILQKYTFLKLASLI